MLLIILNPWTGWAFRIGEGNAFVWGPLHMLPDDMAALQMLVSLLVVPLANAGGAQARPAAMAGPVHATDRRWNRGESP